MSPSTDLPITAQDRRPRLKPQVSSSKRFLVASLLFLCIFLALHLITQPFQLTGSQSLMSLHHDTTPPAPSQDAAKIKEVDTSRTFIQQRLTRKLLNTVSRIMIEQQTSIMEGLDAEHELTKKAIGGLKDWTAKAAWNRYA